MELYHSCNLEGLDSCTAAVRSKAMALVKRAPPGVKKFIRGWNEENDAVMQQNKSNLLTRKSLTRGGGKLLKNCWWWRVIKKLQPTIHLIILFRDE